MRLLPALLAEYVEIKNIQITKEEELCILGCFNDNGTINQMNKFEEFAFRCSDKHLLVSVAEHISANNTNFELCNPNVELPTVSTAIGSFFGWEANGTNADGCNANKGMKLCISKQFVHSMTTRITSCGRAT